MANLSYTVGVSHFGICSGLNCTNRNRFCDKRKPVDKLVQILIDHGADIEARNRHGYTPLCLSVSRLDLHLTRILLKFGAKLENLNENKIFNMTFTPLELKNYPLTLNIIEMAHLLKSAGYKISLEERLVIIKYWMKIRGNDTDHLISDDTESSKMFNTDKIKKKIFFHHKYGFHLTQEAEGFLRQKSKKLKNLNPNEYHRFFPREAIDDLTAQVERTKNIMLSENVSLYQMCRMSYSNGYSLIKDIEARNRHGYTPLGLSVSRLDLHLTRILLKFGAKLENLNENKIFNMTFTPLELKNYPLTLNIIEMAHLLKSAGYKISLEERLVIIKYCMKIRGNDTDNLISDDTDEKKMIQELMKLTKSADSKILQMVIALNGGWKDLPEVEYKSLTSKEKVYTPLTKPEANLRRYGAPTLCHYIKWKLFPNLAAHTNLFMNVNQETVHNDLRNVEYHTGLCHHVYSLNLACQLDRSNKILKKLTEPDEDIKNIIDNNEAMLQEVYINHKFNKCPKNLEEAVAAHKKMGMDRFTSLSTIKTNNKCTIPYNLLKNHKDIFYADIYNEKDENEDEDVNESLAELSDDIHRAETPPKKNPAKRKGSPSDSKEEYNNKKKKVDDHSKEPIRKGMPRIKLSELVDLPVNFLKQKESHKSMKSTKLKKSSTTTDSTANLLKEIDSDKTMKDNQYNDNNVENNSNEKSIKMKKLEIPLDSKVVADYLKGREDKADSKKENESLEYNSCSTKEIHRDKTDDVKTGESTGTSNLEMMESEAHDEKDKNTKDSTMVPVESPTKRDEFNNSVSLSPTAPREVLQPNKKMESSEIPNEPETERNNVEMTDGEATDRCSLSSTASIEDIHEEVDNIIDTLESSQLQETSNKETNDGPLSNSSEPPSPAFEYLSQRQNEISTPEQNQDEIPSNVDMNKLMKDVTTEQRVSFRFLENEYFLEFLNKLRPTVKPPKRAELSDTLLEKIYQEVEGKVKAKIDAATTLTVQTSILNPASKGKTLSAENYTKGYELIVKTASKFDGIDKNKLLIQLAQYTARSDFWTTEHVRKSVALVSAVDWWKGPYSCTVVSRVAVAILNLPCSSAATEPTFSAYGWIHNVKRNRFTAARASKVTYIAHNLKLLNPKKKKDICDLESEEEDDEECEIDDYVMDENDQSVRHLSSVLQNEDYVQEGEYIIEEDGSLVQKKLIFKLFI
ncbi:hypothetical protein TKK_0003287 [Trichogramma kaykai]